jgi:hypothetical protein
MSERERSFDQRDYTLDRDQGYTSPPTADRLLRQMLEWLDQGPEYRSRHPIEIGHVMTAVDYLHERAGQIGWQIRDGVRGVPGIMKPGTAVGIYVLGNGKNDVGIAYYESASDRKAPPKLFATNRPRGEGYLNPVDDFPCQLPEPVFIEAFRG